MVVPADPSDDYWAWHVIFRAFTVTCPDERERTLTMVVWLPLVISMFRPLENNSVRAMLQLLKYASGSALVEMLGVYTRLVRSMQSGCDKRVCYALSKAMCSMV
jgi:hypothetical protein